MADTPDVPDAPVVEVAEASDPLMDLLTEDESESPKAAPSAAKKEEPKVAEGAEEVKTPDVPVKETDGDKEEADADDTAAAPTDETDQQPQGKAEERKQQLNTEIRDLVSQRNQLRDDIAKQNAEVYQPATEDELVDQGMSATDAKIEALNQKLEMRDYNERLAEAQLTIESESQRVLTDFPIFNPQSSDYNKEIAESAAEILNESLQTDPNTGQITGSSVSPYKLYKTIAASHNVSSQAGQLKGQEATEKMLSRADDAGGVAPKSAPKDPLMDLLLSDDY